MREKKEIRSEMRAARRMMSAADRATQSRDVCARAFACVGATLATKKGTLAIYLASTEEVDVTDLIVRARAAGICVVAPRWNGASYDLAVVTGLDGANLRTGPMGIREPAAANLVTPADVDAWIVPGLAFTRDGRRLGYGGGWYDRFLARARPSSRRIGVAFTCQIADGLPDEPHDIRLTDVVTATETFFALADGSFEKESQ